MYFMLPNPVHEAVTLSASSSLIKMSKDSVRELISKTLNSLEVSSINFRTVGGGELSSDDTDIGVIENLLGSLAKTLRTYFVDCWQLSPQK